MRTALAAGFLEPTDYVMNLNGSALGYWHLMPDQPLTRQEAAVLTVRALGYGMEAQRPALHDGVELTPLDFADAHAIPVWLSEWVSIAKRTGVIGGYPDGTFQPGNRIKRAEAVVMLERFAARQPITPDVTQELRLRQPDCLDYYYNIDPRRTTPIRATARATGSSSEVYEAFVSLSAAEQEELLRTYTLAFWEQVKDRDDLGQNLSGVRVQLETSGFFELASATYDGVAFEPRFHLKALGTAGSDVLPTLASAFTLEVENLDGQIAQANKEIERHLRPFLEQIAQAKCTVTYAFPYQYLGEWFSANPETLSTWTQATVKAEFAAKQAAIAELGGNLAWLNLRVIPDTNYQIPAYKDLNLLDTLRANPVLEATYTGRYLTVQTRAASLSDWLSNAKIAYNPLPPSEVPLPYNPPESVARQVFETFIYTLGRLPD